MRFAIPSALGPCAWRIPGLQSEEHEDESHHEEHAEDALGDGQVQDFNTTGVMGAVIVSGVVFLGVPPSAWSSLWSWAP